MSRRPPQISPVQKQHLANLSRAQLNERAASRKIEAMTRELDRSFAEAKEAVDKNANVLREHYAWANRCGLWLARVALLPMLALAVGIIVAVILGLWDGEIKELQKSSNLYVNRVGNPIAYWASVIYHSALASFISWITVVVFRAARIGRNTAS